MSWTGQVCDHLRDWHSRFPGRIESYAFGEDIDLSAAAGAIATAKGTLKDVDRSGTDEFRLRKGYGVPEIIGILGIDESGGGAGGYLQIQGRARKLRFGKMSQIAANEFWEWIPTRPIQVPEGSKISNVGNKSGSGAEQHAVVIYIHYPKLRKIAMEFQALPSVYGPLGLKTGTRVAATFGPWTAEPVTDWEDSELDFAEDPGLKFIIEQFINGPGLADTSLVALRWPGKETDQFEIIVPASMGGSECIFNLPPIPYSAENPLKLAAFGAAVTSDEYGFVVACSAPYGDTNAPGSEGNPGPTPLNPQAPWIGSGGGTSGGTIETGGRFSVNQFRR